MSFQQKVQYYVLSTFGFVFGSYYLWWWFSPSRLSDTTNLPLGIILFVTLSFVTLHRPFIELYGWVVLRKLSDRRPPTPPDGLKVALITTFVPGSEPISMLEKTLRAMVAAHYEHDTWVLDEGDDDEVKALCCLLGVKYFTRRGIDKYNTNGGTFAKKTKGGNHNAWYDAHGYEYELVAQFDTDFVVKPNVLMHTLGYFNDPKVAYVGTPQIYGNMDSWVARGAAEQTYMFYGPVMKGLGDREQGLLIGANHVIRVSALREIGLYFAHLVEDLATGMTFSSKGWKGVYTTEVLAVGEGPSTWSAYFTQQYRWAFGCLHLFFRHSAKLVSHMPFRQAARYLWMQTFYLNGLAMGLGILLLSGYYLTGVTPGSMPLNGLILHYAPLLVFRQIAILWAQRFNARPEIESGMLWAGRFITMAALPVYLMAFIGVIRNKRMTFKVTPKGEEWEVPVKPEGWSVFKPHVVIATILLLGMSMAGQLHHTNLIFFLWGMSTVTLMIVFSLVPSWIYRLRQFALMTWRALSATTRRAIRTDDPDPEFAE